HIVRYSTQSSPWRLGSSILPTCLFQILCCLLCLTVSFSTILIKVAGFPTLLLGSKAAHVGCHPWNSPTEGDHFVDDSKQKQYVDLQAHILEKVVLFSYQSGYIFIHTDKTIYTPASTVYYRVLCMTPGLEPLTREMFEDKEVAKNKDITDSVEIRTPDSITIFREIINPYKGVNSGMFHLPEIVSFGTWHVVTRFQSTPQKTSSDFEVKEYVLDSFKVSLTPAKAFFYVDNKALTVDIYAKYLYGKEVTGTVCGMSFQQRVEIREGKGVCREERDLDRHFSIHHALQENTQILQTWHALRLCLHYKS
uniref:Uncharacterized protein n=1 Tax=Hucho hucho TaxID=62062 RepID=A0A4W5PLZ8_9TELE